MDIETRVKEAEAYYSQGLFNESLELYEALLADATQAAPDRLSDFEARIAKLREEIETVAQPDPQLSAEDLSFIRDTWGVDEQAPEIYSAAQSLQELGLFKEASDEYFRLLALDFPLDSYIGSMLQCLLEVHSPSRVIDQIESVMSEREVETETRAQIYFEFGRAMETREYFDLALEYYEAVKKIAPDTEGIDDSIGAIQDNRSYDSRYTYLLESKLVSTQQLQNALAMSKKTKSSVEFALMDQFRIERDEIGKSLSLFYKCPFQPYDPDLPVPYELLRKLKKAFLHQNAWVPLGWEMSEGVVEILIDDPHDLTKTDNIPNLIRARKINYHVGIREDIQKIVETFYSERKDDDMAAGDDENDAFDMIPDIDFEEEEDLEEDAGGDYDEASGQIVRMVDQILISAYRKGASDIHIEPSPLTKKLAIRYRIDGVCQDVLQVPVTNARGVMSRIKIMSGLDIAERRLPQDGKIKFKRKGIKPFELRLATLPTAGGFEDAVLRILAESGALKLGDIGINERNMDIILKCISQPYGLYLVVGPTGSGKTTTLHSCLDHINKPGIKIWTAEDPVEITQLGLRQVECKPKIGLDFARVMRAFLRADPDVIMIGEMRDEETASIGVEASLTGHLVFSTLHTNSAPETITRLLDMGLNPLNFSDAFLAVLAQRLLRRVCKKCAKVYHPDEEEFEDIALTYGKEDFPSSGLEYTDDLKLKTGKGCDECNNTGYKGRMGIHELMSGTPEVKRLIKHAAPTEELFAQAAKDGMTTLMQDGIAKVFQGLTDMDELRRVVVS